MVRALEVTIGSGRPFSSYGPGVAAFPPTNWRLAGVWLPREVVSERIEKRFVSMLEAGFVDEVRGLAAQPEGLSRTARQALGYRELLAHVEEGVPLGRPSTSLCGAPVVSPAASVCGGGGTREYAGSGLPKTPSQYCLPC